MENPGKCSKRQAVPIILAKVADNNLPGIGEHCTAIRGGNIKQCNEINFFIPTI